MSVDQEKARSFLLEWSEQKVPLYLSEYGGDRAGVPKGDDIPFPEHKVRTAVSLLAYGSPNYQTLTAIARKVRVSSALLRVWRTEERFVGLYRRAVWECADDYIHLLSASWDDQWIAPSQEFQTYFGVAVQEAVLRRLCVDMFQMDTVWEHLGLSPKWLSECELIGFPTKKRIRFDTKESSILNINALSLLANCLVGRGIQDPVMAQWASSELMDKWTRSRVANTDLRRAVEKNDNKDALAQIDFITVHPLHDVKKLYRLINPTKTKRRT